MRLWSESIIRYGIWKTRWKLCCKNFLRKNLIKSGCPRVFILSSPLYNSLIACQPYFINHVIVSTIVSSLLTSVFCSIYTISSTWNRRHCDCYLCLFHFVLAFCSPSFCHLSVISCVRFCDCRCNSSIPQSRSLPINSTDLNDVHFPLDHLPQFSANCENSLSLQFFILSIQLDLYHDIQ